MEKYKIGFKKSAVKEIENLPRKEKNIVLHKISLLAQNPRPLDCKKLSGEEKYRIRYRDYRILYAIEENILIVYIVKVGHRKDVYKG